MILLRLIRQQNVRKGKGMAADLKFVGCVDKLQD
jgi:hypothetical protein